MFKIAAAVVDFYDDPDFHASAEAQALIKEGHVRPLEAVSELHDRDFAVLIMTKAGTHRKFPIYSPMATGLSGRYYEDIEEALPEEIRKVAGFFLKKAHEEFGLALPPSLAEEYEPVAHNEVSHEPTEDIRIRSTEAVVKMAQYSFTSHSREMKPMEKVAMAMDVNRAVESCGEVLTEQEIWDYVPKDIYGLHAEEMLEQRQTLSKEAGKQIEAAFEQILDEFAKMPPTEGPFLIHQFDKTAGFDYRYDLGGVMDPFWGAWAGFSLPSKEAGATEDLFRHKLETIAIYDRLLKRTFGEPFVTKFTQDPKGTYEIATPEQKKVLDFLIANIPTKKPENSDKPMAPGRDEASKVTKDLKKTQVKPSDKPDTINDWRDSIYGAVNAGL